MNKILFGYHTVSFAERETYGRVIKEKPNKILWSQKQTTAPDFLEQAQRYNGVTASRLMVKGPALKKSLL